MQIYYGSFMLNKTRSVIKLSNFAINREPANKGLLEETVYVVSLISNRNNRGPKSDPRT